MSRDLIAVEQWARTQTSRDRLDGNIKIRLFLLGAYLAREHDIISRKFGILGSEMLILFALRRSGGSLEMRPTDLFKSLLLPSATMARHLNRLEKLQLVKRRNDSKDRRVAFVGLTRHGIEVADKALETSSNYSVASRALRALSPGDRRKLDKLLAGLLAETNGDFDGSTWLPVKARKKPKRRGDEISLRSV